MSKHTGTVPLTIDGTTYTLKYDWAAYAELQEKYGKTVARELDDAVDLKQLMGMTLIALRAHHPDMTEAKLMELSPPISDVMAAVDTALVYAQWGPTKGQEIIDKVKQVQAITGLPAEKKTTP